MSQRRNRRACSWILALACSAMAAAELGAQRLTSAPLGREFMYIDNPIGFAGYGLEPYVRPPVYTRRVPQYDRLGNFLMVGELAYSVDEARPGLSRFSGSARALAQGGGLRLNYAALRDSYKGTGFSVMVLTANPNLDARQLAEGIRTQFSPLTMNTTRFAGVRVDARGRRNQTTFLYGRGASERNRFSFFSPGRNERSPVVLWGGHWQSTVGAALRLGTSFVNQHLTDTTVRDGDIFRGNIPYAMQPPERIYVRVTDDSPDDADSPAAAYSVDIIAAGVDAQGLTVKMTSSAELAGADMRHEPLLQPTVSGRPGNGRYEANGVGEQIEFAFALPAGFRPTSVQFLARLAGDYRVGVRQEHPFVDEGTGTVRRSSWPSTADPIHFERAFISAADVRYPTDFKFPESSPAYTLVRARGRGPGLGAPETVRLDYGMPTAQTLASTDFAFEYQSFAIDGELALNLQDFKFPVARGQRSRDAHVAYFLRGSGEAPLLRGRWRPRLGAEVFDIPAAYSGGHDARRGGAVFFTEVAPSPTGALTQEFNLYDDNDDGDQWPDDHPNDSPLSGLNDAGVFPGLDEDGDGILDMDRNANGRPDWSEPFLHYGVDPPDFIYDVDFNNNGLPDMVENDDEADYPYRRGQRGFHVFADFDRLAPRLERLALGYYRADEEATGGQSRARYARLDARYAREGLGEVVVRDVLKQVEDDIADPSYIWKVSRDPSVNSLVVQSSERATAGTLLGLRPPEPDPLRMRKSTVNTLFLESRLTPHGRLEFHSRKKLVVNRQHAGVFADGTGQQSGTLHRWTLASRARYAHPLGAHVVVSAKVKHLLQWDGGAWGEGRTRFGSLAFIADASWRASEKTTLYFGQEGLPLLPFRFSDYQESTNNFRQRTSLFLLRTDWMYWGWLTTAELGIQWQARRAAGEEWRSERTFFFETYVGF